MFGTAVCVVPRNGTDFFFLDAASKRVVGQFGGGVERGNRITNPMEVWRAPRSRVYRVASCLPKGVETLLSFISRFSQEEVKSWEQLGPSFVLRVLSRAALERRRVVFSIIVCSSVK
jgi:hypothetical protein